MFEREYSPVDRLLCGLEDLLRTRTPRTPGAGRREPPAAAAEVPLDDAERRESAALMRVNHAGEVAAQALYQAQGLLARSPRVREAMDRAAEEEGDHLYWCRGRLSELGSRPSLLDPGWFAGAFAIGAVAAAFGDRWSLGFVAETEHQVVEHLDGHLRRLPANDTVSRAILEQMREDEGRHATTAIESGGVALPGPVRRLMRSFARVMTTTAYWV